MVKRKKTQAQLYKESEVKRKADISAAVTAKQRSQTSIHAKDPAREEIRQAQIGKDPEFAKDVKGKARDLEVKNIAKKSFDIETEKDRLKQESFVEPTLEKTPTESKIDLKIQANNLKLDNEIVDIQAKLATPDGGMLDSINKWRLGVKLDNLIEKRAGNQTLVGVLPIGLPVGSAAAIGRAGLQVGGGLPGAAINPKTTALTGAWLLRAGFATRAAVFLGSLIGLTAWGKHVKSEAIEFLPFQIQKAREAGDEETAQELEALFDEVANPTGWANIIEEVPGLGVIKAALDKIKVGAAIIEAQNKRAA